MPTVDYGQVFCDAVKSIIDGEVAKLEFDISQECTIIKVNDRAYGKYQVSDGSIKFEAIAGEGDYYEVGDRVMVTIPKGDYNKQISILSKVIDEWSGPAGFVRPLDTIMQCTDNIAISAAAAELVANGNIKSKKILHLTEQKFLGFQKIGLSAQFKTLTSGLNIIDGTYGLKVSLIELAEDGTVKQAEMFNFSNKDMLGNPYEFSNYFTQEYAFNIPEGFDHIHEVIVEFYQNNDFIDGSQNKISQSPVSDLFVQGLEIYFGYDINKNLNEIVEIHSDYTTYDANTTKTIDLTWFHKLSENKMESITKDTPEFKNGVYGIRWYKYISGCAEEYIDKVYGGANWFWLNPSENSTSLTGSLMEQYPFTTDEPKSLDTFPFSLEAPVLATKEKEQFKAVCLKKTYPLINDPTYEVIEHWTSNVITFENTNEETSGGENITEVIHRDLALVFDDNSFGNYFIYDQNGELLDEPKEGSNKTRKIMLYYKGMAINEDNPIDVTKVVWHLPNKANSMITYNVDQHKNQEVAKEFAYTISEELDVNASDNTIQCEVFVSGQLYLTLTETLRFGKRGSNGTTNTLILEMMDGKNAIALGDTDGLRVQAILVRESGKRVYFSAEDDKTIAWNLVNKHNQITLKTTGTEDVIQLTYSGQTVPKDNYTILKASYKYEENGPELEAYLPIPIKDASQCDYIVGPTQIIYNHLGVPSYNNGVYIAKHRTWNNNSQTWDSIDRRLWWGCTRDINNNPNPVTLKKSNEFGGEGYSLSAAPLYSKQKNNDNAIQDKVCVFCNIGSQEKPNIIWSQPILIMQSQYDFAMLNEWDSTLTIDEKNGTILSTMLGAGRKNEQNKFSGVLIGDIQGGTELNSTETLTGVYGLKDGVMTYGLKEDGSAFFGAYAKGRIEIDGQHGIIKSPMDKGMMIDLDDGLIQASNFTLSAGHWGSDKSQTQGRIILSTSGVKNDSAGDKQNYYFVIGTKDNYMSLATNGALMIAAQTFNFTSADIGMNISNNEFLLQHNTNNKIHFSSNGLTINTTSFNLSSGYWGSSDLSKTQGRVIMSTNGIRDNSAGDNNVSYYFGVGTKDNWIALNTRGQLAINTTNFKVTNEGNVTVTGEIKATSGKIGGDNGWTIATNAISTSTPLGSDNSFHMYSSGTQASDIKIAGHPDKNWRLGIGSNFGVTNTGALYCKSANINNTTFDTATITNATITTATIKNATINSSCTFYGTLSGVSGTFSTLTATNRINMRGKSIYFGVNDSYQLYTLTSDYGNNAVTGIGVSGDFVVNSSLHVNSSIRAKSITCVNGVYASTLSAGFLLGVDGDSYTTAHITFGSRSSTTIDGTLSFSGYPIYIAFHLDDYDSGAAYVLHGDIIKSLKEKISGLETRVAELEK